MSYAAALAALAVAGFGATAGSGGASASGAPVAHQLAAADSPWTGTLTITRKQPYAPNCNTLTHTGQTPSLGGCNVVEKTVWNLDQPAGDNVTNGSWSASETYTYPWACDENDATDRDVGTGTDSGTGTYQIVNHGDHAELILVHTSPQNLFVTWPCGYSYPDVPDAPGCPCYNLPPVELQFAADGTLTGQVDVVNPPDAQLQTPLPGVTQVITYSINGIHPFAPTTTPSSTTTPSTSTQPTTQTGTTTTTGGGSGSGGSAGSGPGGTLNSAAKQVCQNPLSGAALTTGSVGTGIVGLISNPETDASATSAAIGGAAVSAVGLGCAIFYPSDSAPMYARDACIGLAGAGLALSLAPLVFGGPDALLIGEAVGGMLLGNFGYYVCSADPPLRSYRVIAEPRKHTIHIKFKGFNAVQDRVLNAAAQNTDNANSLSQAMTLCLDRASGAAQAGATVWVRRQRACAAKYANTLAQTTRAQLQWQSAVSQLLRNAGLKDASLTPAILLKTLQSPSAEQTQQLKREGFNAGQMKLIQAAVTNPTVAAAMPNRIYASIDGPTVRSALIKAAKAYDAIYELNR